IRAFHVTGVQTCALPIFGFRTRLAAVAYTGVMIVAFLMAHMDPLFVLGKSGAWLHEGIALFLFGGLGLSFTGGGKYALSTNNQRSEERRVGNERKFRRGG